MIRYSKCSRYAINWRSIFNFTDLNYIDIQPNASWPKENCLDGWIYNKTTVMSSIVIDVGYIKHFPTLSFRNLNRY